MCAESVIMNCFNGEEYLSEALDSVLEQTYDNWELVFWDNLSTDRSSNIFHSIDDSRFYYFLAEDHTNLGQARAEAWNKAKGEFVAILDVDDIWLPDKLNFQVKYMKDYDVIGSKCVYFGDSNGIPNIPINNISDFNFLLYNPIINSSCLLKKKLCYWEGNFNIEDYNLWLHLWIKNKKFFNVPKILVKHRIHKNSFFNNDNGKYVQELKQKYKKIILDLKKKSKLYK